MTREQLLFLQKHGILVLPKFYETNTLPSDTDPTQDIPIKRLNLAANGLPINVKMHPAYFTNAGVESLSSIDRRNNDPFDVLGELQKTENTFKIK